MKHFIILSLFLLYFTFSFAQGFSKSYQDTANSLAATLYGNFSDEEKIAANLALENISQEFLSKDSSLNFTYDSISFLRHLTSEDGSFALLTWAVPLENDQLLYSGFVQKLNTGRRSQSRVDTIFLLKAADKSPDKNASYPTDQWPGAVYDRILPKAKNADYYTLLAWVGKPQGLAGKRIETLTFDTAGDPMFGVPAIIMKEGSVQNRLDFEYTSEMPFHLAYELQRLPGEKRKTGWMIVFNRLGGNTPGMGRMFRGPVPSFDTYDALIPIGSQWVLFEDIDPRANTKDLDDSPPQEIGLPRVK